jgi:hypothetical protein
VEAKRGDAVVIVQETSDYIIGKGRESKTRVTLGIVTNIKRDGSVKAYRDIGYGTAMPIERIVGLKRMFIVPATVVATEDVERVARSRYWDGHPTQLKYWDSAEDIKAALKPYAKAVTK